LGTNVRAPPPQESQRTDTRQQQPGSRRQWHGCEFNRVEICVEREECRKLAGSVRERQRQSSPRKDAGRVPGRQVCECFGRTEHARAGKWRKRGSKITVRAS